MKGNMAPPIMPALTIHPIAPDRRWGGRKPPHWFMRIGNIGPITTPTSATATADGMSSGSAQMNISSLRSVSEAQTSEVYWEYRPCCDHGI